MKRWFILGLIAATGLMAQTQNNVIRFGSSQVDVKCFNKAAAGWYRNIEMRSNSTPIRVYFQKNDKSIVDITGNTVFITYESTDRGDDIAAVTVDGNKNFWGVKCVYFISVTVPNKNIEVNGEQKELVGNMSLDYLGLPLWISRNTTKS